MRNVEVGGQLFSLGQLVFTPGVADFIAAHKINGLRLLARHAVGDWGDMDAADKRENELSVKQGYRIFSSYNVPGGKIWIITEADRSSTCMLLPEEY